MNDRGENEPSRPSDILIPTITSHVSRRLSQKNSTSSGASADITVVGQSAETDLYVDESHVYGTSQLQQPETELPSLVFNTEVRREESDAEAEPPEQFHVPLEESDEIILNEPVNAERETLPPLEGEEEGEVQEASNAEERDLEERDLTTTRDALAKATKTFSQA